MLAKAAALFLGIWFVAAPLSAQSAAPNQPGNISVSQPDPQSGNRQAPSSPPAAADTQAKQQKNGTSAAPAQEASSQDPSEKKQSKRIFFIIPDYQAVNTSAQLPPLSVKRKFWLATQDSFDYSSFIFTGLQAGVSQANKSYPEFKQGAAGFGRYYWHAFADQALGNYMTEAIVPAITREDPRYYTTDHRGFFYRTGYAVSRLFIIRTDSGGRSFNFSEIVGNGAGAAISGLYYPSQERTWTKTAQKWFTQVAADGVFNFFQEFWPDIRRDIFRRK